MQFNCTDSQGIRQLLSTRRRQEHFASLYSRDHRGADARELSELRLRKPEEDAPITGEPFILRNYYQLTHRDIKRAGNQGQRINLRTPIAGLPLLHCRAAHPSATSKICSTEAFALTRTTKSRGFEPAHNTATHVGIPFVIARHHAAPPLGSKRA
ncbi:hypothetical protein GCM10020255_012220 [Rhodococcus baikonurensis]